MIKTEFMELFEELDNLYEDTDPAKVVASKKFWAAAKADRMEEDAFHIAFDAELTELGLIDMFDANGVLANDYGRIAKAKEANPDSWAIKALGKLWALRYRSNRYFKSELAKIEADKEMRRIEAEKRRAEEEQRRAEEEKRRAEEEAEKARLEQERCNNLAQEYKDLLPRALASIDKKLIDNYKATFEVTNLNFNIEVKQTTRKKFGFGYREPVDCVKFIPCYSGYVFYIDPKEEDKLSDLIDKLSDELSYSIAAKREIDVFNNNNPDKCSAVLLGESGTLYYLGDLPRSESFKTMFKRIRNAGEVTENYKVIYTDVRSSSTSMRATSDDVYHTYYSWDSSEADKIQPLIPEIGPGSGAWDYWETTKLSDGSRRELSTMDNIDSWAYKKHTYLATD